MTSKTKIFDSQCHDDDIYLAMVGDCVVGEGSTAAEAIAHAHERDADIDQAGAVEARRCGRWVRYDLGSILDYDQADTTTTARPRIILARHGQDGRALGFDSQGRPWVRGPTTASGRPARWVRAVCVPV